MQSIMQGLSTASKPPKPEPQVLEITSLLTGIRELVAYDARRASIDVTVEVDDPVLTVCGDRSHVTQILLNLVTNAIEAMSERGGRVVLRARRAGGAAAAMLEVADTGPAIPPDRLETIWDAFYTTKAEGTGLGLAIVRSLVEENGGSISVASEIGQGTVFTIALPAPSAPGDATGRTTPAGA